MVMGKINIISNTSMFVMVVIILVVITVFMSLIHFVPLVDCLKFYAAIFFFIYLPGYSILKLCHWDNNPVSYTILSLLTGVAVTTISYPLIRKADQMWLFILLSVLSLVFFVVKNKKAYEQFTSIKNYHLDKAWWLGLIICCLVLVLLNFSHFGDLIILLNNEGYLLRNDPTSESIYHFGIINALKTTLTPDFPYLSGYNFSYHFGMHLLAEMLCRYTGINSLLMTYYFLPLLYFILLISVSAIFFYQITRNILFSILFGFTLFAEDLSFIANILEFTENSANPSVFRTLTWSIFTLNGILPGIPFLFGAIIMFDRFFRNNKWQNLLLFTLFVVVSFSIKGSIGPHIIGASIISLFIMFVMKECQHCWKIGLTLLLSSIFITIEYIIRPSPTESIQLIKIDPFNSFFLTLERLNINLDILIINQPVLWVIFFLLALLFYIVGSFGVRIVFIKYVLDFFKRRTNQPIIIFLLTFIISGFFLSEFIFIGSNISKINNGGWFAIQSIYIANFFIISLLVSIKNKKRRRVLSILVIIFSFTGTFLFLSDYRNKNKYLHISPQQINLSQFIQQNTFNKSIILEPLYYAPSLVSHLSGRSSPMTVYMVFTEQIASKHIIDERYRDIINFYDKNFIGSRKEIIKKYNIDYFITTKKLQGNFNEEALGDKIFSNNEYIIYKIK